MQLLLFDEVSPIFSLNDIPVDEAALFELPIDINLMRRGNSLQDDIALDTHVGHLLLINDCLPYALREHFVRFARVFLFLVTVFWGPS
jgi:hypothetical protein